MAKFLSVYSKNLNSKNLNFTKRYPSKDLALQGKYIVTFLPTLRIFFTAKKRFWKTTLRIISQNLGGFQGKCLWRSSVPAKALSLRFTVILVVILNYDFAKLYRVVFRTQWNTKDGAFGQNSPRLKALFLSKAPSQMFHWVLSTPPLYHDSVKCNL